MESSIPNAVMTDTIAQFKRDGYVIIENAIPLDAIETMRAEFMVAMTDKVKRFNLKRAEVSDGRDKGNSNVKIDFRPEGGNHDLNRWNMHLPTSPTFINDTLLANPEVLKVIEHFMGPDVYTFIIASDTPYPGSGFQNIHQDFPRFGITVNVPLVDFTENNAPLEIWQGTHTYNPANNHEFHTGANDLSTEQMNEIVDTIPSRRCLVKAGSILLRDQRMVHRGTGNLSEDPRPCMSIWYKGPAQSNFLTIPIPSRKLADSYATAALNLRRTGRGEGGNIRNQKLLNLGNLFGRVVEELSGSDRDHRRVIPADLWNTLSPRTKKLLRYASVETSDAVVEPPQGKRSPVGTAMFGAIGAGFMAYGSYLKTFPPKTVAKSN